MCIKDEEFEPLSPKEQRELRRITADLDDPIRYAVFSDIGGYGTFRLWLNVSDGCYGTTIDQATLFKRERVALAVAKACSSGKKSRLLVAKITTKNDKRKIVKYGK